LSDFTTLQEIEAFFADIPYKKKDFPPFEMMRRALALLDNPHEKLQYVQITGTNGKGSTSSYLSHFLADSGLRVGLFTSPHLFMITERIKVNNTSIPVAAFIAHFNRIYRLIYPQCKLIQFEWLYLIALDYFTTQALDVVILEVGIGGKFDTTTTIPHKLAAVITNISYDHRSLLGSSLEAITQQKQAIITEQTRGAFIGNVTDDTLVSLIKEQLTETNTPGFFLFYDFWFDVEAHIFSFFEQTITVTNENLAPYQYENITLALAVAAYIGEYFEKPLNQAAAKQTIETLQIPIRFEVVTKADTAYVFDGAHNLAGLDTLIETLSVQFPATSYVFVYAAMVDKDYTAMLDLLSRNGKVFLYDFHALYPRAFVAQEQDAFPILEDQAALKQMIRTEQDKIIVFVGSMYFVSYIRNLFQQEVLP